MADKNADNSDGRQTEDTPILEWIIAAIGLILVVGTIGFMMYKGLTSKDTPPNFTTKIERIEAVNSGYIVIFDLENIGEQTASGVNVEGELKNGGESVETSGVTFDYAPSKSETKGGLFFKNDPKQFQIEIRAKGYAEP
ncbi:hypothetical protein BH20ACI1_BH20ACI1_02100 [soil metagenome]